MKYLSILLFTLFLFSIKTKGQTPPSNDYKLVFSDDFNDGVIDGDKWWPTTCDSRGDEEQVYVSDNITENNGYLVLTAEYNPTSCGTWSKSYTSGQVFSAPEFKYGYFEISAKIPEGRALFPAFWFWSGHNGSAYQEIDVFEFCSKYSNNCGNLDVGYYYDDNNDGNAELDSNKHLYYQSPFSNGCNSFNVYGVEWTPSQIKFFLNGRQIASFPNNNIHEPMPIIMNLALGGTCSKACHAPLPSSYEIDWVKGWQKANQIIYMKGGNEMCIGDVLEIKAPVFPYAVYNWIPSSGLQTTPTGFTTSGGVWKNTTVTANAGGLHSVTLTIDFPSGYSETKTHYIRVYDGPPSTPVDISYYLSTLEECCYEIYTPIVPEASSYSWSFGNYNRTTNINYLNDCLSGGNINISVQSTNACEESQIYTENIFLPFLTACSDPSMQLTISPNPVSSQITLNILDKENKKINDIKGNVVISDSFGNIVFSSMVEENNKTININQLKKGTYYVLFTDNETRVSSTFLKND